MAAEVSGWLTYDSTVPHHTTGRVPFAVEAGNTITRSDFQFFDS
jgi:hypothetical protein